ncbi:hypothetical protein AB0E08_04960 [Streptomyces sp. NPDC048281]|uniref:hypothetical protein n=1 Tax=Streptomyces sp. NPDC048281 TaxID=3154715 RepID=UPI003443AF2C
MTSRTKAKADDDSGSTTTEAAAPSEAEAEAAPALCAAVHHLPLLAHVTCQRPAGHTDDQPQGPDQDKHRAEIDGALYVW